MSDTGQMWSLKYRPQTFADVSGQQVTMAVLQQMVRKNAVPTALVFSGVRGSGKTSTARILGAALNCDRAPDGPCLSCVHCRAVANGSSIDVMEIDAASNGSVDQIRHLRETVLYATGGEYRLVMLDEAHSMSREAFNALLKTLEEPPDNTVFILLTTEPSRILDTILSRCMVFEFRKISPGDIVARLQHICRAEDFQVEPGLLAYMAERSDGGLRDAVMSLDQAHRVGITRLDQFMALVGDSDYAPEIFAAMLDGNKTELFSLVDRQLSRIGDAQAIASDLTRTVRDLLVIKSGGDAGRQGEQRKAREALAARISERALIRTCNLLWEMKTKIRVGDDVRSGLDLAVVLMTEILAPAAAEQSPAPVPALQIPQQPETPEPSAPKTNGVPAPGGIVRLSEITARLKAAIPEATRGTP